MSGRALIVDDSRAMRAILRGVLKSCGFDTLEAADGKAALATLEGAGPVDLACVDWNMPEMNGFEFVQAVRADPAYAKVRLLMVTSESEVSRIQSALEAGADEFLMKPFVREAMLEKLALLGLPPEPS